MTERLKRNTERDFSARPALYLRALPVAFFLAALLAACGPVCAGEEYAFVITTDYYSAAYYSTIEILPPRTTDINISSISTDAVAYYDQDEDMVFVVNRYLADNIQIVDPNSGFATIGQYSVGNGSNPHDIRLAGSNKAYVTRYEWKTLLICDPYTGDSLGVIDLSCLADSDGIPEMDRMEIVDGKVFITLNSIDRSTWLPEGPGKIAVIDAVADTLIDVDPTTAGVQPIWLTLPNPYTKLRYDRCRGELMVGCLGSWGALDGGIEVIDPFTLEHKGVIITEAELGGDISDAILSPGPRGYAVVMDSVPWPDNFARLLSFDRETGQVEDTLYIQTSGYGASLAAIELNRQRELYLCDRDATQPCVRIFDSPADTLIDAVDVGLPPFDIAFVQEAYADVPAEPGLETPDAVSLMGYPNPARHTATIEFCVPGGAGHARMRLGIYDVQGRLVRMLDAGDLEAGTHRIAWDGTDERGRPAASGVYYCRLEGRGAGAGARIVFIR